MVDTLLINFHVALRIHTYFARENSNLYGVVIYNSTAQIRILAIFTILVGLFAYKKLTVFYFNSKCTHFFHRNDILTELADQCAYRSYTKSETNRKFQH